MKARPDDSGKARRPQLDTNEGGNMANDNQRAGEQSAAPPPIDPIALALQRLHQEVATETLPDSFLALLDALDEADTSPKHDRILPGGSAA